MREKNLLNALLNLFSTSDALLLEKLLKDIFRKEAIRYEDIDIAASQKNDVLLMAFEERILIPAKSRSGPAWEDKILDFTNTGHYFIPPVVKAILNTMCETGEPSCERAVKKTLTNVIQEDPGDFVKLLQTIMIHAVNYTFETGLLEIFFKKRAMDCDLHDVIDIFVICGMISPCPRKSLMTGLAWYEINPTLYWDKTFLA